MWKVICGDCEAEMTKLRKKSIDVVITSPPYNMTKRKGGYADKVKRYDEYIDWKPENEYISWLCNIFNAINSVLNDKGVVLLNLSYSIENPSLPFKTISKIVETTQFNLVDTIVWKKKTAIPFPANKYRLVRICEFIFVFVKKGRENDFNIFKPITKVSKKTGQKYYEVVQNLIEAKNNDGINNLNKATFSTEMVEKLLQIYSDKNMTVLDPFMGIGTTGLACINKNINFIGIEISQKQCDYAIRKFTETERSVKHGT